MGETKTELSKTICGTIERNERWLLQENPEVYHSAVELVNDAVDLVSACAKGKQPTESYEKLALHFFAYHVLLPGSYSLTLNLLAGGLPSCFRELRFLTEMIAKCYLADVHYPDLPSFHEKLRALEGDGERAHKPVTPIMREFDKRLQSDDDATNLWKILSRESHARKYVDRFVRNVFEQGKISAYTLPLPAPYAEADAPDLLELKRYIDQFFGILHRATGK